MNKQIIIRLLISFIFIAFSLRVLVPIFYNFIKLKLSAQNGHNDIDWMIKKKKEQLNAQYGLTPVATRTPNNSQNLVHEIMKHIALCYSYNISENKIKIFLDKVKNRNYTNFLSDKENKNTKNLVNFLSQTLLLTLLTEEINRKSFTMSQILAKKLSLNLYKFSMGIQIKILLHMKSGSITEEQVFNEEYVLNSYSENTISAAVESIMHKEASLWCQSPSMLFEELALYFHYASIVRPIPILKNKTDTKTALLILDCEENASIDEIKKNYKKMALEKHPDKITAQKLPPRLEKKGIKNFNQIQEAYEVLCHNKK